ncbi:MAG: VCBS repeat-containing protein [Myxococcales bacterium]|nr:VCBS repeat-containing protein [Myxococcales bacterium]
MRILPTLWLVACLTTSTEDTTTHTGSPVELYPPADVVWTMFAFTSGGASYLGQSLAIHAEGPILGAPSRFVDEPATPYVFMPSAPYTSGSPQDDWFWFENASTWVDSEDLYHLGSAVLAPGDVTGDGVDDLVVFDDSAVASVPSGFLVAGPLAGRRLHADDPGIVPLFGPRNGTPCGDVTGDGRTDLCLDTGIFAGPVTAPATPTVTWSAFDPWETRLAAGDLDGDGRNELLVWDRAGTAIRVLTTFPPGDHALEALATHSITAPPDTSVNALEVGGDLNGDGREDLVVAWESEARGRRVSIVIDPASSSLEQTWATWEGVANAVAVGDLDDDGVDDLVFGGRTATSLESETVTVLLGPLHAGTLTQADVAITWPGATLDPLMDNDRFGHAIELGDVDGDGDDDLLISAPSEDGDTEVPFGKVYLTLGPWTP